MYQKPYRLCSMDTLYMNTNFMSIKLSDTDATRYKQSKAIGQLV